MYPSSLIYKTVHTLVMFFAGKGQRRAYKSWIYCLYCSSGMSVLAGTNQEDYYTSNVYDIQTCSET